LAFQDERSSAKDSPAAESAASADPLVEFLNQRRAAWTSSAAELPRRELYYTLWSAARDIAGGGDGLVTTPLASSKQDIDVEPDFLGELAAAGMADRLACRPEDLGPRWTAFEPKLRKAIEAIFPGRARDRLRTLAIGAAKARANGGRAGDDDVLQLGDATAPRTLAEAHQFAVLQVRANRGVLAAAALPLLGALSGSDLADAVLQQIRRAPLAATLKARRPWLRLAFWAAAGDALLRVRGLGLRRLARNPAMLRQILRYRLRHALAVGLEATLRVDLQPLARQGGLSRHCEVLARLAADANRERPPAAPACRHPAERFTRGAVGPGPTTSWDEFFQAEDPWNYAGSDYERLKYDDTLELIPPGPHISALELACAEGHFTIRLAPCVGSLLATDISERALERAKARCAGQSNVAFRQLDFMRQLLSGQYDLIVCSEVLYHAGPRLPAVAANVVGALRAGGLLVATHANQITDEPQATGFDWGLDYGSRTIGETFASIPGLVLEREIHRPLYRVQVFRKLAEGAPRAAAVLDRRPLAVTLEPTVARNVVWGGGESRIAAIRREVALSLPILLYRRVAPIEDARPERSTISPEAFEEQMAWLRRRGFRSVTAEQLADSLAANEPLLGRPVMITFEDAHAGFVEHAWPILQKHDLPPTLFVAPGEIGDAPALGWADVAELSASGVAIESHGFSRRALTRPSVRAAYRELLRSRAAIEKAAGRAPISISYPFGALDAVVERIAVECGYRLGFSTTPGLATLADNPLRLPRLEITNQDDLAAFARKLGQAEAASG
jgi:peptidoglycan/xylan/chitin deacetylase (PgdA/CDA1 family)